MDAKSWEKVRYLYDLACELPQEQLGGFLDDHWISRCGRYGAESTGRILPVPVADAARRSPPGDAMRACKRTRRALDDRNQPAVPSIRIFSSHRGIRRCFAVDIGVEKMSVVLANMLEELCHLHIITTNTHVGIKKQKGRKS